MKISNIAIYAIILPVYLLIACVTLYADTVYLKDGQEAKGVLVEDYHDRVVISTEKGEISYSKNDIEKITYDTPEIDMVKLAAMYKDKGEYRTAYYYYETAYRLNPGMKEAQEGMLLVNNLLIKEKDNDLKMQVAMRQDTEDNIGRSKDTESLLTYIDMKAQELKDKLGLSIKQENGQTIVENVYRDSPAKKSGIKDGDRIISVWGKLIRYMQLKDIYKLLMDETASELRIAISRQADMTVKKKSMFSGAEEMIGGSFTMAFEGLTVESVDPGGALDNAGIIKGDMITKLGAVSTRYIPLETAYRIVEDSKDGTVAFELQREFALWRR